MGTQNFKVACVNWADSVAVFNDKARKEIAAVIDDLLEDVSTRKIAGSPPLNFTHSVVWDIKSDKLEPHDVVIYFVADVTKCKAVKNGFAKATEIPAKAQGLTVRVPPKGKLQFVTCEVFVDGGFPTKRLGNAAFHELMHTKLDVGTGAVPDMHKLAGGGLTQPPTEEGDKLVDATIKLMRANMFTAVPMFTKDM
jgi:hypothetical protein